MVIYYLKIVGVQEYDKVDVFLNNEYIVIGQTKANDIEGMKNQGEYDMFAVKYSYINYII